MTHPAFAMIINTRFIMYDEFKSVLGLIEGLWFKSKTGFQMMQAQSAFVEENPENCCWSLL